MPQKHVVVRRAQGPELARVPVSFAEAVSIQESLDGTLVEVIVGALPGVGDGAPPTSALDHFEVFKGEDKQFYFRRVAANGEIVASSEGYKRQKDAFAEAETQADGLEVRKV